VLDELAQPMIVALLTAGRSHETDHWPAVRRRSTTGGSAAGATIRTPHDGNSRANMQNVCEHSSEEIRRAYGCRRARA